MSELESELSGVNFAERRVLLVDPDPASREALKAGISGAGYAVTSVDSLAAAKAAFARSDYALIVSEAELPDGDGITLRAPTTTGDGVPLVILTQREDLEHKVECLRRGVSDYLQKPIYMQELLARIELLFRGQPSTEGEGADAEDELQGSLKSTSVVELVQMLELGRKSAVAEIRDPQRDHGRLWIRDGQIVDAEVGLLEGDVAFYRMLGWTHGGFRVAFVDQWSRPTSIERSTQGLLMEGMRRCDEFQRLAREIDLEASYRFLEQSSVTSPVALLMDGERRLARVIELSPMGELETLKHVVELHAAGTIERVATIAEGLGAIDIAEIDAFVGDRFEEPEWPREGTLPHFLAIEPGSENRDETTRPDLPRMMPMSEAIPKPRIVAHPSNRRRPEDELVAAAIENALVTELEPPKEPALLLQKPAARSQYGLLRRKAVAVVGFLGLAAGAAFGLALLEPTPAATSQIATLPLDDGRIEMEPLRISVQRVRQMEPVDRAYRALERAQALQSRGENQEAVTLLEQQVFAHLPYEIDAHLTAAEAYLDLGEPAPAKYHLLNVQRIRKDHGRGLILLGHAYHGEGRPEMAMNAYQGFIERYPDDPQVAQIEELIERRYRN